MEWIQYSADATVRLVSTAPPAALAAAALLAYVVLAWAVRVSERRVLVPAPALKGFAAHAADAAAVVGQVRAFLAARAPGQAMTIRRSRGGVADSNRTIDPLYKRGALAVDVSALDAVVAVEALPPGDARARAAGAGVHPAHPPPIALLHIEPGLPMDELARAALAHGLVPQVVLEFPGITAGGAICGGGIESSSHAFGSFMDTVAEVDIVTGDGRFRQGVSRDREPELFAALSASYGSLGVLTRVAVRCEAAHPYVRVRYLHADGMASATAMMEALANARSPPAFIDGVALSESSAVVVVGDYADAPAPDAPLRTLRQRRDDPWFFWHLTDVARGAPALAYADAAPRAAAGATGAGAGAGAATGPSPRRAKPAPAAAPSAASRPPDDAGAVLRAYAARVESVLIEDYLFRFDRGAFWMARHGLSVFWGAAAYRAAGARAGPDWWVRVKYAWLASTRQLYRMLHAIGDEMLARHYVIQDYVMPSRAAAVALAETTAAQPLGVWPLWVCPVRMVRVRARGDAGFGFPVQETREGGLMFNVGVYGSPARGEPFDPVAVNRALEARATALGGRKMLYAQSYYDAPEFWALFDRAAYDAVRAAVGAVGVFPDVAAKLLLGPRRLAALAGARAVSFAPAAAAMAKWYLSLWAEAILPRALHSRAVGVEHTGMTTYAKAAGAAAARLSPAAARAGVAAVAAAVDAAAEGGASAATGGRGRARALPAPAAAAAGTAAAAASPARRRRGSASAHAAA